MEFLLHESLEMEPGNSSLASVSDFRAPSSPFGIVLSICIYVFDNLYLEYLLLWKSIKQLKKQFTRRITAQ